MPHPLKILLVEDDPDTLLALKAFMESMGHQVAEATRVDDALEDLAKGGFDLLLSDIGLPDGNGWDLLKRASFPPPLSVAMSGFGLNADRSRSREAGFRHHLLKPFRPEELEAILAEASGNIPR